MFMTINDFHKLYYNCFILIPSQKAERDTLQKQILNLAFNFKTNSVDVNKAKLSEIKDILSKDSALAKTLLIQSQSVNNGQAFWNMFSFPFEKVENVFKIIVTRFSEINAEILKSFDSLDALEFAFSEKDLVLPKTNANSNTQTKKSYYKSSEGSSQAFFRISKTEQLNSIRGNPFSESEVNRATPEVANAIRSFRDTCAKKVLSGELVEDSIDIVPSKNMIGQYEIVCSKVVNKRMHKYEVSLQFLLYNEIKNEKIKDQTEAQKFLFDQIDKNSMFYPIEQDLQETLLNFHNNLKTISVPAILDMFKDALNYSQSQTLKS